MKGVFRSLRGFNYRLWVMCALVSNIGTWMQRIAQDWLILTQLTHHNATAVGITTALQFGPQVILLPLTGWAADHIDRRKLLTVTQGLMGLLALGLGCLTVAGVVETWHVYLFALLLGCVAAFDSPARQTFISDLVDEKHIGNAVALNSTSFNAARLIGPAVAGVVIAGVGSGWAFLLNAASFGAVLAALAFLRPHEMHRHNRSGKGRTRLADGFRYVWSRPDLKALLTMISLIGTFGLNFAVFISAMSVKVFHAGAGAYGLLTSSMAIGSVTGALLAARREQPTLKVVLIGAIVFGCGCALAAFAPTYPLFAAALIVVGVSAQTFTTSVNGLIQLSTDPAMRGRVMAIFVALALGGQPLGAPLVGFIADRYGPRWALGVGAAAGLAAAAVGFAYLASRGTARERAALTSQP